LLAAVKFGSFSLLGISLEYAVVRQSADLLLKVQLVYDATEYVGEISQMLAFFFGCLLFYSLLFKSNAVSM
jgi:hypothetical protein